MVTTARLKKLACPLTNREVRLARRGDSDLGALAPLPGVWHDAGHGWNMIALPFARSGPPFRLLLNQYDENLRFSIVDKAVPNRGHNAATTPLETDRFVVTLDYEQIIKQVASTDSPDSDQAGLPGAIIHHEPGLFLDMLNQVPGGLDVARLATIPHGDAVLALGSSSTVPGMPPIPAVSGLPVGIDPSPTGLDADNLAPYELFHGAPFVGTVAFPGFPGFDPVHPHLLPPPGEPGSPRGLHDDPGAVEQERQCGHPQPALRRQERQRHLDELDLLDPGAVTDLDNSGRKKPRLQYLQVVMLDFAPRRDGLPGLIGWPHISINTLDQVPDDPAAVVPLWAVPARSAGPPAYGDGRRAAPHRGGTALPAGVCRSALD